MEFLKIIGIITFVIAVTTRITCAHSVDTKIVNAINEVVSIRKSYTCVILAVEGKVKFVSTEADASNKLAKWRNGIDKKNLQIIKSSFRLLSTNDVLEKLSKITEIHSTFLVYFTASIHKQRKGSITTETTKPIGLIGKLLASLGLKVEEKGLLTIVLSLLGVNTNVKDIKIIEFEY